MTNEEMQERVIEHDSRIKGTEKRINDLERKTDKLESLTLSVQKLALSVEQMANAQDEYRSEQKNLAERILNVEQQPDKEKANKFDKIWSQIATLVIGAFVGYLLKTFFGI